ncbi:MAG TPA: MarR family winged helix-turn-helix transcriptional regulator [Gaiellaceae bacterium]|jgi:DNA-binding MarR family transcriptional regulator|nr:MarR family winged helix-turn-helix transcriptional regulator [Gaiellaceae bacterium]
MNELPAAPLFLLYVATAKVGNVLAAALEGGPFTVEEAVVLNQIDVLEPVTPSVLAARLGISPSTLSYRLRALQRRRLVSRDDNPHDGRSALLTLTPLGRRQWERVLPLWLATIRAMEDGLETPRDEVVAVLRELVAAADRALAAPSRRRTA